MGQNISSLLRLLTILPTPSFPRLWISKFEMPVISKSKFFFLLSAIPEELEPTEETENDTLDTRDIMYRKSREITEGHSRNNH